MDPSSLSHVELVSRDTGVSVSEVEGLWAFQASVEEAMAGVPGVIESGWDEFPSRSGFVEVVGTASAATIAFFAGLGLRVVDGFEYDREEQGLRVRAVANYLFEHGVKAMVSHEGDRVLLELTESHYETIDAPVLSENVSVVASGAVEPRPAAITATDQVIIRTIPDSRIPRRRSNE